MDGESASRLESAVQRREQIRQPRAGNAFNLLSDLFSGAMRVAENSRSGPEPSTLLPARAKSIASSPGPRPKGPNLLRPRPPRCTEDAPFPRHSVPPPYLALARCRFPAPSILAEVALFIGCSLKTGLTPLGFPGSMLLRFGHTKEFVWYQ